MTATVEKPTNMWVTLTRTIDRAEGTFNRIQKVCLVKISEYPKEVVAECSDTEAMQLLSNIPDSEVLEHGADVPMLIAVTYGAYYYRKGGHWQCHYRPSGVTTHNSKRLEMTDLRKLLRKDKKSNAPTGGEEAGKSVQAPAVQA